MTGNFQRSPDGVCAVPLLPNKNVILVKEWRPAWKQPILQIPAGKCSSNKEADRIIQIRRELQEEIGYDAKTIKKLINFGAFAGIHHSSHVYLATNLFPSTVEKLAEDIHEHVEVTIMPLDDALNLFLSGREFTTSYTLIGLILAKHKP